MLIRGIGNETSSGTSTLKTKYLRVGYNYTHTGFLTLTEIEIAKMLKGIYNHQFTPQGEGSWYNISLGVHFYKSIWYFSE